MNPTDNYEEIIHLRDELKNISKLLENLVVNTNARLDILEKEWNTKKVQQENPQKIILNIGGKHFASTKETLTSKKDSFFFAMLSSGKWTPDEDGTYFIDRDPKYFRYLLNYLRNGECPDLSDLSQVQLKELKKEANFYCLDEMFGDCKLSLNFLAEEGCIQSTISQNKVTITGDLSSHLNIFNLTKLEKGTFTWKVKITELSWLALGVVQANRVEQKVFDDFVYPYRTHGCYVSSYHNYSWEPSKDHYRNTFSFKNGDELELKMNCELKKLIITNISVRNQVTISDILLPVYPCFVANGKLECEMEWISHELI